MKINFEFESAKEAATFISSLNGNKSIFDNIKVSGLPRVREAKKSINSRNSSVTVDQAMPYVISVKSFDAQQFASHFGINIKNARATIANMTKKKKITFHDCVDGRSSWRATKKSRLNKA